MARTANLQLPLVQASQAQKHVTVNEAFGLLDGLAQLALASLTTTTPPSGAPDGTAYAIPPLAANEWGTEIGKVAISSNGGWIYVAPRAGCYAAAPGGSGCTRSCSTCRTSASRSPPSA